MIWFDGKNGKEETPSDRDKSATDESARIECFCIGTMEMTEDQVYELNWK